MGQEVIFPIGALILGVVIAYAVVSNRRKNRNPMNDMLGDAAAKEQYRNPEEYDPGKFREELQPNPDGSDPKSAS